MAKLKPEKLIEDKVFKRRRANKQYSSLQLQKSWSRKSQKDQENLALLSHELNNSLSKIGVKSSNRNSLIQFPANFTFFDNYENSILTINEFAGSMTNVLAGTITLDFSKCRLAETGTIFLLQIIRNELEELISNSRIRFLTLRPHSTFKVIPSKIKTVNRLLFLSSILTKDGYDKCKILYNDAVEDLLEPIDRTGYLQGSTAQSEFSENKKSIHTSTVVKYVNSCLKKHEYEFNAFGQNRLEGIISEILNNAEDHGIYNNWYVTANFSKENDQSRVLEDVVGELNLVIFNFGGSIYDGLIENSLDNEIIYNDLVSTKRALDEKFPYHTFTEDNLFTLYALQDGISRLKFIDISRGTGTMKFLNSFLSLGDFEDLTKGYKPNLSIYTGHTHLICDNLYKPVVNDDVYSLTLNPENSLSSLPKSSHLKILHNKLPGTLLTVKVYLSKGHLDQKYT